MILVAGCCDVAAGGVLVLLDECVVSLLKSQKKNEAPTRLVLLAFANE